LLLIVFLASALGAGNSFCIVGSDDAAARVGEAEVALRRTFSAVLEAESAGANVSELLVELDVAGGNLTAAEMAYARGDFDEASSRAQQCTAVADGVAGEAQSLKNSASTRARNKELQTIGFSMIGGLASVLVVSLIWVLFKRSYLGKLSGMKPEAEK